MLFRALPVVIVACAAFILATGQSAAQSVRDRLAKDVVVATVAGGRRQWRWAVWVGRSWES